MEWLLLAVLGIIWAAFLVPRGRLDQGVRGFEREMDILSHLQRPGRWVLMPRRDERFLGSHGRSRARARERRRRVLTVLAEAVGLTFLIGAFPPLRAMWVATAALLALAGAYVYLVVRMRGSAVAAAGLRRAAASQAGSNGPAASPGQLGPNVYGPQAPVLDEDELADAGIRVLAP